MEWITYTKDQREVFGCLVAERVIAYEEIEKELAVPACNNLLDFIEKSSSELLEKIEKWLAKKTWQGISKEEVVLQAPIKYPLRNVICIGKNYDEHIKEIAGEFFGRQKEIEPIYFSKGAFPILGDQANISAHAQITKSMDYECELAVVIGKKGKDIPQADVREYIFGYSIGIDYTGRNLQKKHKQWFKGKSLDGWTVMGPGIVTKENSLSDFQIRTWVNGELRQNGQSQDMIFSVEEIIEDLSRGMTLYPGDIIFTGTPAGVGMGMDPPAFLRAGDELEFQIKPIGRLKNKII